MLWLRGLVESIRFVYAAEKTSPKEYMRDIYVVYTHYY